MANVQIGSAFVRQPSFLEQRDTLTGSFAQAMPQLTAFDEDLQEALLATAADRADRLVGWVCAAAWVFLLGLVATGNA